MLEQPVVAARPMQHKAERAKRKVGVFIYILSSKSVFIKNG
jgi:hypothetical protein